MAAGVADIYIEQGATYSRTLTLMALKATTYAVTDSTGYIIGSTSIVLPAGGSGVIASGDYVSFTGSDETATKQYLVATGVASLATGGTLVLSSGIETALLAEANTIKVYSPTDLTGYTARGKIKSGATSTTTIVSFTTDIPTFTDGKITISLTATQTASITTTGEKYSSLTKYYYDVEIEDGSGVVTRVLNGIARVSPEITK